MATRKTGQSSKAKKPGARKQPVTKTGSSKKAARKAS